MVLCGFDDTKSSDDEISNHWIRQLTAKIKPDLASLSVNVY